MHAHGGAAARSRNSYSGESSSKRQRDSSGAFIPMSMSMAPPQSALSTTETDAELTLAQRLRRNVQSAIYHTQGLDLGAGEGHHGDLLSVELMRRYIEYAKLYVQPVLTPAAAKVLQRLYLTMRAQASAGQSIPVTTRHLESLIRLAQARARIDLREEVRILSGTL